MSVLSPPFDYVCRQQSKITMQPIRWCKITIEFCGSQRCQTFSVFFCAGGSVCGTGAALCLHLSFYSCLRFGTLVSFLTSFMKQKFLDHGSSKVQWNTCEESV